MQLIASFLYKVFMKKTFSYLECSSGRVECSFEFWQTCRYVFNKILNFFAQIPKKHHFLKKILILSLWLRRNNLWQPTELFWSEFWKLFAQNLEIILKWVDFAQKICLLQTLHATLKSFFCSIDDDEPAFFLKKVEKVFALNSETVRQQLYCFQKKLSKMTL